MLNFIKIPPEGFSRGLWLLEKNNGDSRIDIIRTQNRLIHCIIRENKNDIQWLATFVYGSDYAMKYQT